MTGIVIFAMIAAFLGLRLYAVLGKRTGHEPPMKRAPEEALRPVGVPPSVEDGRETAEAIEAPQAPGAEAGIRAIMTADRSFSPAEFVEGAKGAYRLILEAFWAGKEDEFTPYVDDDVRAAFAESIAQRATDGHVLDNRLVTIERAQIVDAQFERGTATVVVRFDADIAAVTRDVDGKLIEGSMTDAVPTQDIWTFTRQTAAADPNWILTDTDQVS